MEEQTEQSNDAIGLSVPQQETTFEEEETSPPQGTSADPLTQIADALSKLLVAPSPREIDVSPYDGTFEAQSFFDNFDAQADRAELTYTDRLRKLPCYLQGKPLQYFRNLRLDRLFYNDVRQTLIDLFPTATEASFSRFLAIKLTPQMPLEDYYQNKTVMGMKLNLPADILIDSLTEGLPVADQRLIATVQPNTIKEWFDLVSRIRRTQCATSAAYQRQVDKAPHPTYHIPPPRHNNQRSSRVTYQVAPPPSPCKYCNAMHWHSQCEQRFQQDRTSQVYNARPRTTTVPKSGTRPKVQSRSPVPQVQAASRDDSTSPASNSTSNNSCYKTKRFCIDYRKLNEIISPDVHPLPLIETILDKLSKAKYYSSVDIASAYWQVEVEPNSRNLLAFVTLDTLSTTLVSSRFTMPPLLRRIHPRDRRHTQTGFVSADIIKQHQPTASPFNIDTNGLHTITRKGVIKIIIPETLQHTLMNKVHQEYNHPGISQMTRIITAQYYWKGISKSIEKFVKSCHTCQIIKRPKGKPYGALGQIPAPQQPFDLISIDTIAGFSKYGHSKTYLHVIVDHLTRYAWTFPSKSTSTLTYIQTLKTVLQQGSPKRLLSDRAPAFTSEKFRNLRLAYLENPKASWTQLVKRVTQTYNNTPHSVTSFPPTYLMFNVIPPDLRTQLNPYPEINIAREIANSRTQNKHKKDKETFDKQHRTPHFEVNDLVLVKNYRHPDTDKNSELNLHTFKPDTYGGKKICLSRVNISLSKYYRNFLLICVVLMLLILAGIEQNPGPRMSKQTTLETSLDRDKEIKDLINALTKRLDNWGERLESRLSAIDDRVENINQRLQQLEESSAVTKAALSQNSKKIKDLEDQLEYLDAKSRERNLIFYGIEQDINEDCRERIRRVIEENMRTTEKINITRCHRVSRKPGAPILVEVPEQNDRTTLFKAAFNLRGTKISLSKDYSMKMREQRRVLNVKRRELVEKERGSSVLDYFMYTHGLTQIISDMWIEEVSYSDHLPIVLQINTGYEAIKSSYKNEILIRKFIWTKENVEMLKHNLSNIEVGNETDINTETANFTKQIYTAMESANIIKFAKRRHQLSKPWYDKDCYIMKKTTKVSLQRCRNSNNIHDRQKYIEARREYFKLLQRKRDEFNKDKNERIKNAKDPKSFWNAIASFRKKPIIQGEIDIKEWFLFYKNLLNKENKEATFTVNQMIGWKDPDLDAEITLEEIHDVVKKLANGKAVGLDGIPNELLKNLPIPTLNKLKNLFNKIMSTEKYPQLWTNSIVHPIYKSGDKNNPTNYRGIALCSNISKLFTTILSNRLNNWIEKRVIILENQAGFRKNRSCTDHIILLNSLIQLSLRRKRGKLYVFFVDLTKAFDTVPHDLLWQKLHKMGISNKFVMLIKNFYQEAKITIRWKGQYSNNVKINSGVLQGESLSPLLFILYMADLIELYNNSALTGFHLPDFGVLHLLMYADDIAIIGESKINLQIKINLLKSYLDKNKLVLNENKSKIIVFRNGGRPARHENWFYPINMCSLFPLWKHTIRPRLRHQSPTSTIHQSHSARNRTDTHPSGDSPAVDRRADASRVDPASGSGHTPFDGTYAARQFFQAYDRKMDKPS
ncbi:hypothetical protein LAZ67_11001654 [Cordylochernes scorpioides]|uniref:Reverse transcriptase n=1 Tax=Cordylochernes scorpioides TaxID=51811 RepID=A0ABY6L2G2_9ARAC|nr:hypothetical protein LAZ67_11001654 [Cordylochernes scorpioides]